jgi:two-component system NtrC family sensor kinase
MVKQLFHHIIKQIKDIDLYSNILRKRIIHYCSVLFLIIVGAIGVTVFYNFRIEEKFNFLSKTYDLRETVFEMRVSETNYLLYGQFSDYDRNKLLCQRAIIFFRTNKNEFIDIVPNKRLLYGEELLQRYSKIMDKLYERISTISPSPLIHHDSLTAEMRKSGQEVLKYSRFLYVREHNDFVDFLITSRLIIISSFFPFIIIALFMGNIMSKKIVEPIKVIEKKARRIGRGNFTGIPVKKDSHPREIQTLLEAFNTMSSELERRQKQLVHSEKLASLGTLVSGIAHELNNPLSNISTSAQILSEEIEGNDIFFKKELVHKINEQTDRARDIIRTLLDFSRPERFETKLLNLKKLFEETIVLIKSDVPLKIELITNIPEEVMIKADKQTIQQLLINLIMNAVQSIPENQEGRITINAWNNREKGSVGITIRDTGMGIEQENISKIFDPFFTTKDVGKGSGLGLYIAHNIVEQHNGTIEVKSAPRKGTTFVIHLPLGEIRYGV